MKREDLIVSVRAMARRAEKIAAELEGEDVDQGRVDELAGRLSQAWRAIHGIGESSPDRLAALFAALEIASDYAQRCQEAGQSPEAAGEAGAVLLGHVFPHSEIYAAMDRPKLVQAILEWHHGPGRARKSDGREGKFEALSWALDP